MIVFGRVSFCIVVAFCNTQWKVGDALRLSSLRDMEEYHKDLHPELVSRVGNLDEVPNPDSSDGDNLQICHIVNMNSHDEQIGLGPSNVLATSLALEHLNSGNGIVVPEVDGLNKRCPIRFTTEFLDTRNDKLVAMEQLVDVVLNRTSRKPCAFLGNTYSTVTIATSVLTSIFDFAQVSVTSSSEQLDDERYHPLFARAGPSASQFAEPLLDYIYHQWGVRHLAILVSNDDGQSSLAESLLNSRKDYDDMDLIKVVRIPNKASHKDYENAISLLKQTNLRFFATFLLPQDHVPVLEEAWRQGIAGTGIHNWIHQGMAFGQMATRSKFPRNSTFVKAAKGNVLYSPKMGINGIGGSDEYGKEVLALKDSGEDIEYLQTKLPDTVNRSAFENHNFAQTNAAEALYYDAAILMGLAACHSHQVYHNVKGSSHHQAMLATEFNGVTGKFWLNNQTYSREVSSASWAILNYVAVLVGSEYMFREVETDYFVNGEWESVSEVVFNDGTTNIPPDLPLLEVQESHIDTGMRIVGFILATIAILTSATLAFWTYLNGSSRVVKAAQPPFLFLICLGTSLMGSSIFPLGIDDGIVTVRSATFACYGYPYLMSIGWSFAFAALYSKTRLVNKMFCNPAFTALVLKKSDIVWPIGLLIGVNTVILVLWTTLAPLRWETRTVRVDEFGRNEETLGMCYSVGQRASDAFWISLVIVNAGALVFALQQAYAARKISTAFAESVFIYQAMIIILVVSCVACPVVFLVRDDIKAFFFVRAVYAFVSSMSLLLFLFIPKIFYLRKFGNVAFKHAVKVSVDRVQNRSSSPSGQTSETSDLAKVGALGAYSPKSDIELLRARNRALEVRLAELEGSMECSPPNSLSRKVASQSAVASNSVESNDALQDYLHGLYG